MKHSIPYILIALLVVSLFFALTNKRVEYIEKHTTDTITSVRIDTLRLIRDTFIYERIVDTLYLEKTSENAFKLVFTQKYYHNDNYSAWVSGYKPSLDSINVYNKIVTNTIMKEVVREVYPKRTDVFLNVGGMMIDGTFSPSIGATVKFRNDMAVGADIGMYDKKAFYGLKFGYKINR